MSRQEVHPPFLQLLQLRLILKGLFMALGMTRNLRRSLRTLVAFLKYHRKDPSFGPHANLFKVDGKIYWNANCPGYPSAAFDQVLHRWLAHHVGLVPRPGLRTAYVAITKACALNCEHCFEWDSINQVDAPDDKALLDTIDQMLGLGAAQVVFTGGEPLMRYESLLIALNTFHGRAVEFWINTSAVGLSCDRIRELKAAGLTGVFFSLDHFDEQEHDRFRGRKGCFRKVVRGIQAANAANLVTALSLCATRSFVTLPNINAYMVLARELGASYVQMIEAKPLGKMNGLDVALREDQRLLLESVFDKSFHSDRSGGYPVISYLDYMNRKKGCLGGRMYLYVDTDGQVYPCPFCRTKRVHLEQLTLASMASGLACPEMGQMAVGEGFEPPRPFPA